MKILIVNKFLYPRGGSESYMLYLGQYLEKIGHEVQLGIVQECIHRIWIFIPKALQDFCILSK